MFLTTPLRPLFDARTYRDLLFVAAAIPVAALVLAVVVAGSTAVAVLAITPLVVPALIGYRGAVGLLARMDARLAGSLLDVTAAPPQISSGGRGFWGSAKAVLTDESFWRQQAYLVLRMGVGFALAVIELSLIALGAGWITFPIWYRWTDTSLGSYHFDTLDRSLAFAVAGVVALLAAGWLARPFAKVSAWQVLSLLVARPVVPRSAAQRQGLGRRALAYHAGALVGLVLSQVVIWTFTGAGYFWPEWVLLPLALVLAIHAWVVIVAEKLPGAVERGLAIHAGAVAALAIFLTLVWGVTGEGYFWPGWAFLGLAIPLGIHVFVVHRRSRLATRNAPTG
jgi:hypothetical protein